MNDLGFLGHIPLEDTLPLFVQCRNGSDVVTAPASAPTFDIYPVGFASATDSGSLGASDTDSKTGFRTGSQDVTAANGFTAGAFYTVLISYTISGTDYAATGTFQVI